MYANIGRLKLTEIPGAKTLQLAHYGGLPFVVGKEYNETDLYVIFMPDGQLGEVFANHHDLIDRGLDKDGKKLGGYFGKNRKVRSLKLMKGQVTSVGFVMPLSCLEPWGDTSKLKEGDEVDTFNGIDIAHKFLVTGKKFNVRGLKVNRRNVDGFNEHPDTKQFYQKVQEIEPGSLLNISLKIDGTSARYGYLPVTEHMNWWERFLNRFVPLNKTKYTFVIGTRRVVLEPSNTSGFYGSHDLWYEIGKQLEGKLLPGETVYGEIVGWMNEKPIQSRGGVDFTYGLPKGQAKFYVYNIRHVMPNGFEYDLTWEQIKARCEMMGLETVPEMTQPFVFDGDYDLLSNTVYGYTDGPDYLGDHLREGVVLRVEHRGQVRFLKSKSAAFYELESKQKEQATEPDLEESQDA